MTYKQFFPITVMIAILAACLMILDANKASFLPQFLSWVAFQAWAMYFLAGCTLKGGAKVMLGYLGGAVASVAILELNGVFAGWGLGGAALPLAVFIIVIPVISAEQVPWLDFVPAWFVGAGVFFGLITTKTDWPAEAGMGMKYWIAGQHLMVSCAVGMVFGIVTVFLRTKYETWLKSTLPPAAEDAPPAEAIGSA